MAFFPLTKPLEGLALTTTACHLYRASLSRVLPFSIAFALMVHLIQNGHFYVPAAWQAQYQMFAMFLGVLCLPILAAIIITIDNVAKGKIATYSEIMNIVLQRFVSLMAAIISMLLLPAAVLAIGIIIEFVLLNAKLPDLVIFSWRVLLGLILFAAFTPKLFAPLLVFTDNLDGNSALESSDLLVKDQFLRTYGHGLYGFIFLILLFIFSSFLGWLVPNVKVVPIMFLNTIGHLLIAFVVSWPFALWLTQQADCQFRKRSLITPPPIKKPLPNGEPPPVKDENKNDKISF